MMPSQHNGCGHSAPPVWRGISRGPAHQLLLRIARNEVHRRGAQTPITGPELDDLAHQAAGDAMLAIGGKLDQFRGESRFTSWAYKFGIFEVSSKLARHFWLNLSAPMEAEDWDRLPDRFGLDPAAAESRELIAALRLAVEDELTERSGGYSPRSRSTASRSTRW
jgi:RNA polymerase sigma-70 factor, ECF subfamily